MEIIHSPAAVHPHCVDIVVVHDYDETTENWTYKDEKEVLRQEIDNIMSKVKRSKAQKEPENASLASREERKDSKLDLNKPRPGDPKASSGPKAPEDPVKEPESPIGAKTGRAIAVEAEPPSPHHAETPRGPQPAAEGHLGTEIREGSVSARQGSTRTSSPARAVSGPNWLLDAEMLPKALPGARVLAFSYPKLRPKEGGQADYFDRAAQGLLDELAKHQRPEDANSLIPVVFIGAGFGGLVVQKAISLATPNPNTDAESETAKSTIQEKSTEPEKNPADLSHIADIIFLDTPFPDGSGSKYTFPANSNVRMCAIISVMEKMESQWKGLTISMIWNEFWESLSRLAPDTRTTWFYSTSRAHPPRPAIAAEGLQVTFNPVSAPRLRRLSNFPNSGDKIYSRIVECLCYHLMLKAVTDSRLRRLQSDLMKGDVPVNLTTSDERGRTLLHLAATAGNPTGVNLLLGSKANTQAQDPSGRTPLHHAIRMFCECADQAAGSGNETKQDHFKDVIKQLLNHTRKTELYNSRDQWGLTPIDLIHDSQEPCACSPPPCRHAAIRELLESHQPIIRKRAEEQAEDPWRGWSPPDDGPARKACIQARATLAEFYESTEDAAGAGQVLADFESPSILDLIYQKDQGPVKILSKLKERHVGDICCRWIHIPANNVSIGQVGHTSFKLFSLN